MNRKYKFRKISAALIGSFAVFCTATTYFWVNPMQGLFLSDHSPVNMTQDELSWYTAVIEVGDLIGTIPSGYLVDRFGRKFVLFLSGPMIVATWLLVQFTSSYNILLLTRIIQGLAVACVFTAAPVYLGEVSDKKARGMAGTLVQTMWYCGTLFQYIVGSQLGYIASINFVCLLPALVFTVLLCFCPETPRYYILNEKRDKAAKTLAWLYGDEESKHHLEGMIQSETGIINQRRKNSIVTFFKDFIEIFSNRKPIKSLLIISLMSITNVIGVIPVLSYSTETFIRIAKVNPLICNVFMGSMSLVTALIAAMTVDKVGRKPLLLISTISCSIVLLAGGFLYVFVKETILSVVCLALYPPLMSLGPGTLTYALLPELFIDKHRGIGAALITMITAAATGFGLKLYSVVELTLGLEFNFFILGIVTAIASIIIYKYVPETKGMTFEEIQTIL